MRRAVEFIFAVSGAGVLQEGQLTEVGQLWGYVYK